MKKYLGNSVEKLSRRQVVAGSVLGGVAMFFSACGGGGGSNDGDSSEYIDLEAAYERITACMDYDEILKAVGAKPNYYDSKNTLRWNYGDLWLRVQTQNIGEVGEGRWVVDDKELLRGIQRLKRYAFPGYCS
ncbi:hypothetical protein [Hydrogenophaga sp. NFH-34]|uniref:hypothetical protein n=1 Tax=Hydrogenophaga sp. NFH-34 TaxID=2744446 RepID=UPI001F3FB108|nr:hypothetical protein [Hydrogenophaga sp. NFH-34]